MSRRLAFINGSLVLADRVVEGSLVVEDGHIKSIDGNPTNGAEVVDLTGDYLLPGLVELHTDNLEKHFEPRPGVVWPSSLAAILAHDGQIAVAGITTVLDAVCLGDFDSDGRRRAMLERSIGALRQARNSGVLRAEHLLHLRCELADPAVADLFDRFIEEACLRLISVMDHTPGQRQWTDLERFRQFHRDEVWSDDQLQREVAKRQALMDSNSQRHRKLIVERGRRAGIPLASHDDTTPAHIAEAVAEGIGIAEFPTSRVAAELARRQGMTVIMGAPNLVRGGSHSGNVSTAELAAAGLVDALSSDYVPSSLLHAAFMLHQQHAIELPAAVGMVTRSPARMIGLTDRGEIAPGLRADLVRVHMVGEVPTVRSAWRQGERIV